MRAQRIWPEALKLLYRAQLDEPEPDENDDWVVSMRDDRPMGAVCDEVFASCDNNWSQDSVGWRAPRLDGVESMATVSLRQARAVRGEHVAARRPEATLIRSARRERIGRRPLLCRSSIVWLAACLMLGAFCFGWSAWSSSAPDRSTARAAVPASAPVTYVTKNIEDVRKGETVVAWDPVTGELGRHEVTNTFERTSDHLRVLELAAESDGQTQTLETTDEHPFWSVEAGDFVAAGDLCIGDRFISPAGEFSTLRATHRDEHPEGVAVYNFEVADVHNYYVRAHGLRAPPVRVHNAQGYGGKALEGRQVLLRYGSRLEAIETQATRGLAPRPGHLNAPKRVLVPGGPSTPPFGQPKNYTHEMKIIGKRGADLRTWLQKNAEGILGHPDGFAIPPRKLREFNDLIDLIIVSRR